MKKSGCALSMLALATQARHFGMMSALAQKMDDRTSDAANAPTDYRALVCIFMQGGNDGNNMVIPIHSDANISNYAAYAAARATQGLAIPQNQLLPIDVPRLGGLTYGLHPSLGPASAQGGINKGIHELWAQGKLAIVTNVGNLVRPMTRSQYIANSVQKPFQLFSHSDQVQQQQSARSDQRAYTGWGGRIADARTNSDNSGALVPMITSIADTQIFTIGQASTPLAISGNAPLNQTLVLFNDGNEAVSTAQRTAFNTLRTQDLDSKVISAMSHITDQAVQSSNAFRTFREVKTKFPNTSLGNQLKQVARIIKNRDDLSIKRQVFFVQIGSFDSHTNQLASAGFGGGQNGLLIQFGQAVRAFYDEMIAQGVQNNVTTFTLSDFGRTFNPTGAGIQVGSDHAWGNHLLVIGGAVYGGDFYGSTRPDGTGNLYPTLVQGGPDDTDAGSTPRGRWIPTTAVDQYGATLARWFGVADSELPSVFPNIGNFTTSNLDFMNL